jgi:hypothetical protein
MWMPLPCTWNDMNAASTPYGLVLAWQAGRMPVSVARSGLPPPWLKIISGPFKKGYACGNLKINYVVRHILAAFFGRRAYVALVGIQRRRPVRTANVSWVTVVAHQGRCAR